MSALHVIAFSGGKDSTALALRLAEVEPRDFVLLCTPTGDELPDWYDHMRAVAGMVGRLEIATSGMSLNGLVEREGMIPNFRARFCTRILKIEPCREWLKLRAPATLYVGLRADEQGRAGGSYDDIPGVELRHPLREWGWGLSEVQGYLAQRGMAIPERTDCARCWGQQLGQWWRLWHDHPAIYADAEAQEARLGHTWRSPERDTWPAELSGLRERFERGEVPPRTVRQHDLFGSGACRVCSL